MPVNLGLASFVVLGALAVLSCGHAVGPGSSGPDDASNAGSPDATAAGDSGLADAAAPDATADENDGAPHSCDQHSCVNGCCSPDGDCITTFTAAACGYAGAGCSVCPAGASCMGGACLTPMPNCGPSNCAGCCQGPSLCAAGTQDVACGQHGEQCSRCIPQQQTGACAPQIGGGGQCGTCNCRGCCDGNDCALGLAQSQCGSDGENCIACAADQQCMPASTSGGSCGAANPACNATNCAGCCDGNLCAVGDQDVACGTGGATCLNCSQNGSKCAFGGC